MCMGRRQRNFLFVRGEVPTEPLFLPAREIRYEVYPCIFEDLRRYSALDRACYSQSGQNSPDLFTALRLAVSLPKILISLRYDEQSLTGNVTKVTCTFEVPHEKPVPIALHASRAATANRAKLSTVRGASSKFQVDPDEAGCNEGSNLSVSLDPLPQFAEQRRLAGSSKFSGGQICMLWT
ncbi:hypothetical protein ALC60_07911 [Trachymyrmex zeteki]|uniref:Uncharacterized protein n=1 Tax=Mycetomoellerius zeteki TaxID=64791 RepID=A0A151WZ58_9HYME|nr:hypothetical protein ALC60_07911 [Trachymyrmex zeteki]